jgi:hypothetical protein
MMRVVFQEGPKHKPAGRFIDTKRGCRVLLESGTPSLPLLKHEVRWQNLYYASGNTPKVGSVIHDRGAHRAPVLMSGT